MNNQIETGREGGDEGAGGLQQEKSNALNAAQKLHLRVSCEYMDKMLKEIEGILHSAEGKSPFSRYQIDLSPAQGRVIEDYIRRFRSQILRALAWQHIEPPPPSVPATRAINTHLHFVDIAISELRPNQMRGSGALSEATAAELTGVLRELSSICDQMMAYVRHDLDESFRQRVQKLLAEGKASQLLERIESIVTERGMVEFRPRIDMLLARLEDNTFEVAVFGRVSSGKSSFLNALLQVDLLPVGTNPITAVPTRIQHGPTVAAKIRFGNSSLTDVPVDRFRELISERGNPGNREGVRYALLEVPSSRLSQGIILVDTPGLGSLALKGAQETLAYLPSCDLALVLIDAGATLTPEDIGTLRLVLEAGISALVLLSKADLLREQDRDSSVEYIKTQIESELRTTIPVIPVSSLSGFADTINSLYQRELQPRFQRSRELRQQSVQAKLIRLQGDVLASLETRLQRAETAAPIDSDAVSSWEKLLTEAAGQLGALERSLENRILALGFEAPALIERIAERDAASLSTAAEPSSIEIANLAREIQDTVQNEVAEMIALLRENAQEVVAKVTKVGRDLKSSGLPDENEILGLIRDAPRFELPQGSGTIQVGVVRHFGVRFVRNRLIQQMHTQLEPMIKQALTEYSSFLDVWAKRVIRDVQFVVNSSADIYRATVQEMMNGNESTGDREKLRQDIAFLRAETGDAESP